MRFSDQTFLVNLVKDIFSFSYQKLLLSNCTCAIVSNHKKGVVIGRNDSNIVLENPDYVLTN